MNNKGIFITGTGTDIGKTYVSALLAKALKDSGVHVGYYKAAVSGNEWENGKLLPGDARYVRDYAKLDQELEDMVPYVYERAYSPHLAAQLEGNAVDLAVVEQGFRKCMDTHDFVIMEGSGGILCPIRYGSQEIWLEDVIRMSGLPSIIVADAGLGTINHVLLTVSYMEQKGLDILGIIYNNYEEGNILHKDNIFMIEQKAKIKTLAKISANDDSCNLSNIWGELG